MTSTLEISKYINRPDGVQRLGQALWMMVGERVASSEELLWANAILGAGGERILWEALKEAGCIGAGERLLAAQLASFLCSIWGDPMDANFSLMWTLPAGLQVPGVDATGYVKGVRRLIEDGRKRVTLVAPYLEQKGIGHLQEALLGAMARGVCALLITQDATELDSWTSAALEELRREARDYKGALHVYTALPTAPVLLHSKLVAVDSQQAIVGSANLTGSGMLRNLETGVLVGPRQAMEIELVADMAIKLGYVRQVFGTEQA